MYIAFFIYGTVAVMILPSETLSRSGINKQKMLRARALHKTLFSRALYLHERHAVARRIDALASFFHVQAPVLKDELKERESVVRDQKGKRKERKKQKKKKRDPAKKALFSPLLPALEPIFRTLGSLKSALDHEKYRKIVPTSESKSQRKRGKREPGKKKCRRQISVSRKAHLNCKSATGIGIGSEKL